MVFIAKLLALALTAAASPIFLRDAITVQTDINQKIGPQFTTLSNDVDGYPASLLSGAFAIHSDFQRLVPTVNDATSDIKSAGSFSEADGISLLEDLQSLEPTILNTLSAIGSQAPAWTDLPGGQALVLSDLNPLKTSFTDFFNALTAAAPADLVPAITSLETQTVDAFDSAIAAYSF